MPAFLAVALVFAGSVAKEFFGLSKGRRILLNLVLLIALAAVFGLAASPLHPGV